MRIRSHSTDLVGMSQLQKLIAGTILLAFNEDEEKISFTTMQNGEEYLEARMHPGEFDLSPTMRIPTNIMKHVRDYLRKVSDMDPDTGEPQTGSITVCGDNHPDVTVKVETTFKNGKEDWVLTLPARAA